MRRVLEALAGRWWRTTARMSLDGARPWVASLGAGLEEEERGPGGAGKPSGQTGETGVIVATEGARAEECAPANGPVIAKHITRHDPARVLREVDAKRRIIDE